MSRRMWSDAAALAGHFWQTIKRWDAHTGKILVFVARLCGGFKLEEAEGDDFQRRESGQREGWGVVEEG